MLRVLLALVVGIGISLWLIGRNPRVHQLLEQRMMRAFEKMLECKLYGKVVHVNFLSPTMVVEHAGASAHDPSEWQWHSKQCTFTFSYLELLKTRKVAVNVHVDGAVAQSIYDDGHVPLTKHLQKLVSFQQDVPLALKKLLVTHTTLTLATPDHQSAVSLDFKAESSTIGTQFKTTVYLTNGSVVLKNRQLASAITGNAAVEISRDPENAGYGGMVDIDLIAPQLPVGDQQCSLRAAWKNKQGTLALSNKQETCAIKHADIVLTPSGTVHADVEAQFPLSYWNALYAGVAQEREFQGDCYVRARVTDLFNASQNIQGNVQINKCRYKTALVEQIAAKINAQEGTWHADLELIDPLFERIKGELTWYQKEQRGKALFENDARLTCAPFKYWHVLPREIQINVQGDTSGTLEGTIKATAHHEKVGTQAAITGTLHLDHEQFSLQGAVNDKPYVVEIALTPHILLRNVLITDQAGKELIAIKAGKNVHTLFEGTVMFPFLRTVILSCAGYDMRGQGDIQVKTALKDTKLYGQLLLPEGNIRLGTTYNYIQEAVVPVEIDLAAKRCVVMGAHIKLHKGTMRCQRATFEYDQHGHITFAHAPLVFNKLFLNVGKDMFVVVSGYVVLTYHKGEIPLIQGTLSIERAQVKHNILSGPVQGSLLKDLSSSLIGTPSDVALDVRLINQHPIQVRTNVLHTDLDVELYCKGSLAAPRVEGSVNLTHGTLQFPYRPLSIVNGMLHFESHQPDDPRIELTAKGTIKRYAVTMQVGGTVRNPTFSFNSSPALDEEQIITLLLAGSEAGSLSLVMPSLIMQNVQNYIFGTEHGSSTVETYVNNVLAPFKHIRIVPSFSDQTARGGFRGAIEIDVSDRLHATIQKNFSLTEDTRVELEFNVSDDFNIRGIKDERGDLGGEIETRITF